MPVWLVRAGKFGEFQDLALEKNQVVVGWSEVGNLEKIKSKEDMLEMLKDVYKQEKIATLYNWRSQLWAFESKIKAGDLVVLPLKGRASIVIGRVSGPYSYEKGNPEGARHTRPVKWIRTDIPRTDFDQDILYSFGAFSTVCEIKRNNAEARIEVVLGGKKGVSPAKGDSFDASENEEGDLNFETNALDQISNLIKAKYSGHAMQGLVAAILEAQGYVTKVAAEGADGGVDILAGKGPMGFDEPRLCVQVKSGGGAQDVKVVRELHGVMKSVGAQHGLFVSWEGFRQSVHKEFKNTFFEIRLWDSGDLISALLENYEKLPGEIRAEIPLKRIWALVPQEEK